MLTKGRTALFGAAGFLIAILIIAAYPLILPTAAAGTLNIKITDAPADLKHLNMTIDGFEARNETGHWIDVTIEGGSLSFDLLTLDGVTLDAAIGKLEPGNYTMIRMHVVEGLEFTNATLNEVGSEPFPLRVPSEEFKILVRFEIEAGETTIVILDIQVDTISIANNPEENLKPVIKATVIPPD